MDPLEEKLTDINGFYVRNGVRPDYSFDPNASKEPHTVEIVDDNDPDHVKWRATGASINEALARLEQQMKESPQ